jgi:hypothetical protein
LANSNATIKAAFNVWNEHRTSANLAAFKAVFEQYFDPDNLIDYLIVSDVVKNTDGFSKNWQWATYDGVKWWICIYDVDMSFGALSDGSRITPPLTSHLGNDNSLPVYYIQHCYKDELEARYAYLRNAGIIDADAIAQKLNTWIKRIGIKAFESEVEKWPDSPCYGKTELNDGWKLIPGEMGESSTYDSTATYDTGDRCTYGINSYSGFFTFEATEDGVSSVPVKRWKHTDSIYRVKKWLSTSVENMDDVYSYHRGE